MQIRYVDIGGGLGITYEDEHPPTPAQYAGALRQAPGDPGLTLVIAPGRALGGNAALLLTRGPPHKPRVHDFPLQDLEAVLVERGRDDDEILGEIVARYRRLGWNAPAEDLLRRRDEARRAARDDSPSPRGRG